MAKHTLPVIDPGRNEFGFGRTVCGCPDCVSNCRFIPGYLVPADLCRNGEQLAPGDDLLAWSRDHLLASPGAQVMRGGRVFRIRTLVPARRSDGACRFLTADDRWQSGGAYAQVWTVLAEAGRVAPPPEVCRAQMQQAAPLNTKGDI